MIIHPAAQNSVDWMIARAGKPTASEFDNLISPAWKKRTGEMPRSYLAAKIAEAWLGGPLIGFNIWDADQGKIIEDEARPWLELELGVEIKQVGLCLTDDERIGCSPDGIISNSVGVEIKSPQPTAHVKYLLANEIPADYLAQIHGGMYVTGFKSWTFLSYRRNFPNLVITVERDEEIQAKIRDAVSSFVADFDAAMKRMEEINGGPPKHKPLTYVKQPQPEFVSETPLRSEGKNEDTHP